MTDDEAAEARRASDKRRKAQVTRAIVASLDKIIGRPHEDGPPTVAVLIADALVAGEVPHTKVVF